MPGDTTETQRKRRRGADEATRRSDELANKQKHREEVSLSLKTIGDGLKDANVIQSIDSVRSSMRAEEATMERLRFMLIGLNRDNMSEEDSERARVVKNLLDHHGGRVHDYEEELHGLIKKRDG